MDMAALQRAVQGQLQAAQAQSSIPELAATFAAGGAVDRSAAQTGGNAYNAGIDVERQKKAAEEAAKRQAILDDPNSYRAIRKEDGGFDFFDPRGKQIDIATYAQKTNQRPADILKTSDNPIDQQYLQDYSYLTDYVSALQNGDKDTVEAMRSKDSRFAQYDNTGGIDKLIQDFKNYYKRYYTTREQDKQAWGQRPGGMIFRDPGLADLYSSSIGG